MSENDPSVKNALMRDYSDLKIKYLHVRETADQLLDLAVGLKGWRNCTRYSDRSDQLKPFSPTVFRKTLEDVDPLLYDYSWNQYDMTQYLHWSVYHIFAEWLLPPDENGHGALNLGVQEVPPSGGSPMHKGALDPVFASWDDPRKYCAFDITGESGLLIRFWNYDAEQHAFTPRSDGPMAGLLVQWNAVSDTQVEMWTIPVTRDPAFQRDDIVFVDGDISVAMPHEDEESRSFAMAIRDMGRRRRFDRTQYSPVWSMKTLTEPRKGHSFDRFAIDLVDDDELAMMDVDTLTTAYDALWQRYLANKMLTDFALRHKVRDPSELPTDLAALYSDFPLIKG